MSPPVFLLLAALTVASALTVVVHRNPVHSACALVLTLCLLAGAVHRVPEIGRAHV